MAPYPLQSALFQWEEGERRVREVEADLEPAVAAVVEALRRRLGGAFEVSELADLYGEGTDWAEGLAAERSAGTDAGWAVDAAFSRYARQAADFAGGRRHVPVDAES